MHTITALYSSSTYLKAPASLLFPSPYVRTTFESSATLSQRLSTGVQGLDGCIRQSNHHILTELWKGPLDEKQVSEGCHESFIQSQWNPIVRYLLRAVRTPPWSTDIISNAAFFRVWNLSFARPAIMTHRIAWILASLIHEAVEFGAIRTLRMRTPSMPVHFCSKVISCLASRCRG